MSTNGLVPFDYDDPRRPRPYVDDDEDGLLGDVFIGQNVPRGTNSANIPPDANGGQNRGQQSAMLNMPDQPSPSEGEDMPFMPPRVHEAVAGGGAGADSATAAEVGGPGPIPGTYVAQPQNGRPTLAMVPQRQEDLSALATPTGPTPRQPNAIENMQSASDRLAGMGRRPATMADIPKDQQHHGWRKAADIAAAIGIGAYTANPLAGVNVYERMHNAPLRRAQETYDATSGKATSDYERTKQMEAANVGEEKVKALQDKNDVAEERNKAYADKMENTFVAGTERPDTTSPTGYSAETVSGKTKPFTPKQDRAISYDPKMGGFTMNGARYVPKTIDEGAALEAGLSSQFPELNEGPYTQRWEKEKKNQQPQTHISNPSAESEMLHDAKEAFKAQHGHYPQTAEEFDEVNRMRKGEKKAAPINVPNELSKIDLDKQKLIASEQVRFKKEWDKAYKDADGKPDNALLEALKAEHDSIVHGIVQNFEERVNTVKPPQGAPQAAQPVQSQQPPAQPQGGNQPLEQPIAPVRTPAPQQQKPSPSTPAQPAAQQVPPGMPQPNTIVQVAGQYHMVKGYNPTTKKPIISKEIYDPQTKQPVTQAQK